MKIRSCQRFALAAIAVLMASLSPLLGCGEKAAEGEYSAAIKRARVYVQKLRDVFEIPGLAVAVAIDDSIVWSEGFGYANVEKNTPATPETMFRVGSVSKILTAGAVALLYEQGRLDLDVPVQKYVPEFPDKGHAISTRQLAGHLSGIRHYTLDEQEDKRHYDDVIAALEIFKDDGLQHPPGERWSYSTYGWSLISAVVQRAAVQPFLKYMRDRVFDPLGMKNTGPDDITATIANRTIFYEGTERIASDIDISYKWAGGGFLSTAEDLVRYGSAFLPSSNFLKPETIEWLFTNQTTNDGQVVLHGIGWVVQKFENGKPLYYHGGTITGGQAILVVQPEDRMVVAMLANRSSGFGELTANQIACYFLGFGEDDCPEIAGEKKRRIEKHLRYTMLSSAISAWQTAMQTGDLHAAMATCSESFQSEKWPNKSALRRHLQQIFASGSTVVDTENLHFRFRSFGYPIGALTYIEGIKTAGAFGDVSVRLTFVREEAGPMIVNIELRDPES
jgi:CubicO group peptidase (beta-lactamase class C family)